jgi:pimeloyl-ACP methyl ester carboxylesterase
VKLLAPVEASYKGGSGEPMLLLHGFTDTWRAWTPVLSALEARHAVFAPTLPGHHGGEPFGDDVPMTIAASLDKLERQMDAEGIERAHIVGNSLGGWAALELGARGRALSVVALCPGGGWEAGSKEERSVRRYFRQNDLMLRRGRALLHTPARRPRLRHLALRELVANPSNVSASAACAMFEGAAQCAIVKDALELSRRGDMFGDLEEIDCRVRIAPGTKDRLIRWPSHYTRMQAMLPDAEYVPLDGCGHLPMWDDPEQVARVILEVTAPETTQRAAPVVASEAEPTPAAAEPARSAPSPSG